MASGQRGKRGYRNVTYGKSIRHESASSRVMGAFIGALGAAKDQLRRNISICRWFACARATSVSDRQLMWRADIYRRQATRIAEQNVWTRSRSAPWQRFMAHAALTTPAACIARSGAPSGCAAPCEDQRQGRKHQQNAARLARAAR